MSRPWFDERRNIIGLDTGAVYGGMLTCMRWPDRAIFQS
jgi:diadenosine tetraphosphatase ApaH/serine/threonine PP2A family protein phosphatase